MEYNIGDRIVDDKRDITIIDKKKLTRTYIYKYRCNICGYECQDGYRNGRPVKAHWYKPHEIYGQHKGCACCAHSITVPGINSIADTNPELSIYFTNGEEYRYSAQSGYKVDMKCPKCGNIKQQVISTLTLKGFSCPVCASSVSTGERIVYALLDSQNINFKKEFQFQDSRKRYDFYLPDYQTIIEVNGIQHYVQTSNTWGSLQKQQYNDVYKKEFAMQQGISRYVVIDARTSDFNYIKESIIDSKLADIISFDSVNWESIEDSINKNGRVKEMCEYWEQHPEVTVVDMENKFHRSEKIIYDTLKIGYDMGWCRKRTTSNTSIKPIKHISTNIYFHDAKIASRNSLELLGKQIPDSTIRYKAKRNKDFTYVSKEEFNNAYDNGCLCIGDKFLKTS